MKLGVHLEGSFRRIAGELYDDVALIAQGAVTRASHGLLGELRQQVRAAGFRGTDLQNALQVKVYPQKRHSAAAAGWVFSKARRIHAAFHESQVVTARGGRHLAIPLSGAIRRGLHLRSRFGGQKARKWSDLAGLAGMKGLAILPVRHRSDRMIVGIRTGRGFEPLFLLVKNVRLTKRLDFDPPARRWLDRLWADLASRLA